MAAFIAELLAGDDATLAMSGVQVAHTLMEKLPGIFRLYFIREVRVGMCAFIVFYMIITSFPPYVEDISLYGCVFGLFFFASPSGLFHPPPHLPVLSLLLMHGLFSAASNEHPDAHLYRVSCTR